MQMVNDRGLVEQPDREFISSPGQTSLETEAMLGVKKDLALNSVKLLIVWVAIVIWWLEPLTPKHLQRKQVAVR
jgi:hypothetical protein